MAAILGMKGTGDFSTSEMPTSFREKILYEYPEGPAPLLMLLGMLKSEQVDSSKFTIFEQGLPQQEFYITATANGGTAAQHVEFTLSTTAPVTNSAPANSIKPGHILEVYTTGEIVLCTGKKSGSESTIITVVRDVGTSSTYGNNTPVATNVASMKMTIVGSAHEEGSDYPESVMLGPTEEWNYIETFRTSLTLTDDAAQEYYRTGNIEEQSKFNCAMQHSMEQEKAFWFGKRELLTGSVEQQPMRFTGGYKFFIDKAPVSNKIDFSATGLSRNAFLNFLRPIYTVPGGSSNKIAFCGATALGVFTQYAEDLGQIFLEPKDKTYGLQIKTLIHAWGELKLVNHPLFSEHTEWTKAACIIDTRNVMYRFLRGRDTRFLRNRQGNGEDRVVHEYMTKAGLELRHPRTHGYALGIETFVP